MAGRKIRDAADVEMLKRDAATAGVPLVQWARDRGVDGRSLQAWILNTEGRRRASSQGDARGTGLVELVAVNDARPARYVVRVGDLVIELGDEFNETTLRRLLEVVLAC